MATFLTMYKDKSDAQNNINALLLPAPSYSSAKQTASTMVNSGRSSDGVVYAQRVLDRDLTKIEVSWKYLTASQWSAILSKILNGSEKFYVWIRYFDMQAGAFKCRQFYPGDRTATPFRLNQTTKEVMSWLDCGVNFIDTGAEELY